MRRGAIASPHRPPAVLRGPAQPALAIALVMLCATHARAENNDLVLARLSTPVTVGGATNYVEDSLAFRELSSALGVVLAPDLLTPADTLGFDGFQITADVSSTTIDQSGAYWRALQGSAPSAMRTVGVFVRKGMWFPVPSFEIGAGATHLESSSMWTGQLYAKFALHEGFHDWPLPSFAVRGAVSRLMQQTQLDLTVVSLDATISYHLGVGGTWHFDPFLGAAHLLIIPRSEVVDPTPNVDPLAPGNQAAQYNDFAFHDQSTITRDRVIVGAKFQYYVFQLTLEAIYTFTGSSRDQRAGAVGTCMPMTTTTCNAVDDTPAQTTFAGSVGFDF
jgi:hypothetical protein